MSILRCMRTITADDMARIAENMNRKGCVVHYAIGLPDILWVRIKKEELVIREGDNYKETMDKVQALTQYNYDLRRVTDREKQSLRGVSE